MLHCIYSLTLCCNLICFCKGPNKLLLETKINMKRLYICLLVYTQNYTTLYNCEYKCILKLQTPFVLFVQATACTKSLIQIFQFKHVLALNLVFFSTRNCLHTKNNKEPTAGLSINQHVQAWLKSGCFKVHPHTSVDLQSIVKQSCLGGLDWLIGLIVSNDWIV